jgi:glucose-6-phosphate isomerase
MSLSTTTAWRDFATAVRATPLSGDGLDLIEAAGLTVDFSCQRHSSALHAAENSLLDQQGFEAARTALFNGASSTNFTEQRAAWHTALRAAQPTEQVLEQRQRVRDFVQQANAVDRYRHVLHLGIGGSDWGPRMVVQALAGANVKRHVTFVSNVDAHAIEKALKSLDPLNTLIVIASKTFTTTEPLTNAAIALDWLRKAGIEDPLARVVAITANPEAARAYGVLNPHIFEFWDWVGGRYSLWSAIGLPIALALGVDVLDSLLAGAGAMDEHFFNAPRHANAPLRLALAGVANCSVLGYGALALVPYDVRLVSLTSWAQQLEMESLGKSVCKDGNTVDLPISPAVFGMAGTDGQHTFFQWLHQHPQGAPVDFIVAREPDHGYRRSHAILLANCLAQRQALLSGKPLSAVHAEVGKTLAAWAPHRVHAGRRPSTLIVMPRLNAASLGALLALYEHKVFCQAIIWGINAFDQWGVEYGKQLAKRIIGELNGEPPTAGVMRDASTAYWVDALLKPAKAS